jgi:hypothetical protein
MRAGGCCYVLFNSTVYVLSIQYTIIQRNAYSTTVLANY